MDHLCYLCLVFVMLSRLFIAALWPPAGNELSSWLLFVMFNCVFVTFSCGILGQVWYLIVSISDLCHLSNLEIGCNFNIFSKFFKFNETCRIYWNRNLKQACEISSHSEKFFFFFLQKMLSVLESKSETCMWNVTPLRDINFVTKNGVSTGPYK